MEKIMVKTDTKFRETMSYIAELMRLLVLGRTANPPGNITLVPVLPVGGADKEVIQQATDMILYVEVYQEKHQKSRL